MSWGIAHALGEKVRVLISGCPKLGASLDIYITLTHLLVSPFLHLALYTAPPHVDSSSPNTLALPVQGNLTLYCSYTADPAVRGYRWIHNGQTLLPGDENPHYIISPHSLSIDSLLASDGGLYYCNVTNQCGFGLYSFLVHMIGGCVC